MSITPGQTEDNIIKWLPIFEVLSVKRFNWEWQRLGTKREIPAAVRETCRDFVILIHRHALGRDIPFTVQHLHTDTPLAIWRETMSHLDDLGYASELFDWGRQSQTFLDEAGQQEDAFAHSWNILLNRWAAGDAPTDTSDPALDSMMMADFRIMLLRYHVADLQFRLNVNLMKQTPTQDAWQAFAFEHLHVDTWMQLQGDYIGRMSKWRAIYECLSSDETAALLQWASPYLRMHNLPARLPYQSTLGK